MSSILSEEAVLKPQKMDWIESGGRQDASKVDAKSRKRPSQNWARFGEIPGERGSLQPGKKIDHKIFNLLCESDNSEKKKCSENFSFGF